MEVRQFYVTLPSNSSMGIFPKNTQAQYKVKLPEHLSLTGPWEVGLTSITYPHTWINVTDLSRRFYFDTGTGVWDGDLLPLAYYPTAVELVGEINKALVSNKVSGLSLQFDKLTQKVTVTVDKGKRMYFGEGLDTMLGFNKDDIISKTTTAPYVCDLSIGLQSLFVYLDIVDSQIVGDVRAPLLRTVPVQGQDGETITLNYDNPQFLPLATKEFETLEVLITSDVGEKITFERGRVVLTLNFRRSSYL